MIKLVIIFTLIGLGLSAKRTEWPDGGTYTSSGENGGADNDKDSKPTKKVPPKSEKQSTAVVVTEGQEATQALDSVLDVVLGSQAVGQYAFLSEDFLLSIPDDSLAKLRPEVLESLPPSVQAKVASLKVDKAKSTAKLLTQLGPAKFATMPWNVLITQLSPEALNVMGPSQITAIDWQAAMPNMSPEMMKGLSARVLYYIPADSWQYVQEETFVQIEPRALGQLELASLKKIPRSYYDSLPAETLVAIPQDKLLAIDPQLLIKANQVSGGSYARGSASSSASGSGSRVPTQGSGGGEDGGCGDLTLGELTQQVSAGTLTYPCRMRLRRLTRQRVFRNNQRQRQ